MIRFQRLQEQAYDYTKNLLLSNQLDDHVIYSETKVAAMIGISRTPMRDALHKLEQEGLIEIIPSKGFRLKPVSPEGVLKNGQIRSALECYCAVLLAKEYRTVRAHETLQVMEDLIERQESIPENPDYIQEFVSLDVQFHVALVAYSQNAELEEIFHNHLHYMQRMALLSLTEPGRIKGAVKEHKDIYDALRFGDSAHVFEITMIHMNNSQRLYLEHVNSQL